MADIVVHLLDVGRQEYGDSVLCLLGGKSILIDGAHTGDQDGDGDHPGIADQLASLLDTTAPHAIDLLIVSHAHEDHIGCLPWLVAHDVIRPRWTLAPDEGLAWGRDVTEPAPDIHDSAQRLAAALREETRTEGSDDAAIAHLIDAAASLESNYTTMLATIEQNGGRVVRHGRDTPTALQRAFRVIGLRVLGPSDEQMLVTADLMHTSAKDAVDASVRILDSGESEVAAYRRLTAGVDATDSGRPGSLVNLQSIVVTFTVGGRSLLFAGDFQFAAPGTANKVVVAGRDALLAAIAAKAPYAFVKLCHHGSPNGLDDNVMTALGTSQTFGICAGVDSADHPDVAVMALLANQGSRARWARTDRNGLTTFTLGARRTIKTTHGTLNDATPPDADLHRSPAVGETPGTGVATTTRPEGEGTVEHRAIASDDDHVEVVTRIPRRPTRVTVTIEVDPLDGGAATAPDDARIAIAAHRTLPDLLFVTNAAELADNIGAREADGVLAALHAAGHRVVTDVPSNDPAAAAAAVHRAFGAAEPPGIVIVGGYDVVPSFTVNCLPPRLQAVVDTASDPDSFVVWSDEAYGDRGGRTDRQLPVSRIPDGKSAKVVRRALGARGRGNVAARSGVRNVKRPFATDVFAGVPGAGDLFVSRPRVFSDPGATPLGADVVYLMLHGDWMDSTRFWGEQTAHNVEAVNLTNVPATAGDVVFTGCCWGGLTVDTPAAQVVPGHPVAAKTPAASVALAFLLAGATAFVGCTGAHYSPTDPPYDYYGGPLHRAFWAAYQAGAAPAEALVQAKAAFAAGFPRRRDATSEAIEFKLLHQYTCLGLGW